MCSQVISRRPAAAPPLHEMASLNLSQLKEDVQLRAPIYDSRNVLLLAAGAQMTRAVLDRLASRGITRVNVHRSELSRLCGGTPTRESQGATVALKRVLGGSNAGYCPIETIHSRRLDEEIDRGRVAEKGCKGAAAPVKIERHGSTVYDPQLTSTMIKGHAESLQQMESLFEALEAEASVDPEEVESLTSQNLVRVAADLDLFVSLGISPAVDKYPARHGLQASMLAMAMGARMGIDRRSILEMGMGCLVHDAGMLHIDRRVFQAESEVDSIKFLEITKHPILTFDRMRDAERLPGCSRLVAYQMHERCDGSGYPRRRRSNQIHQLAKIAAVADVYVALVSPRPHREGMMPYHAVEHLIRGARDGLFDPQAVRGLLSTVSLFPIGSNVALNDGRRGRVIRTSGDAFTKPIVEVWRGGSLSTPSEVVDLSAETELAIERPLATLEVTPALSAEDLWE